MSIDMDVRETAAQVHRPRLMLCEVTVYIDENTYVGEALTEAQRLAKMFNSKVEQLRLDGNETSLGITISQMPTEDFAQFVIDLAATGIQFTVVTDVSMAPPEEPFLIIHYKNASPAAKKRIQNLINWIEQNGMNVTIGSVTELPNDRPEDGLQIEFQGEES